MPGSSTVRLPIQKVTAASSTDANDILASEEPLDIRLEYGAADQRLQKTISITMRTPGNDEELAVGFLFTEGIIGSVDEINIYLRKQKML